MDDRRVSVAEEVIEPELLSPGAGPRPERPAGPPPSPPGLLGRLKGALAGVLGLAGAALLLTGALLTSTVIGALLGIPLMLAGAFAFYLLLKLLGSGSRHTFTFRRF